MGPTRSAARSWSMRALQYLESCDGELIPSVILLDGSYDVRDGAREIMRLQ